MSSVRVGDFFQCNKTQRVVRLISMKRDRVALAVVDGGVIFTDKDLLIELYRKISLSEAMNIAGTKEQGT